MNNIWYKHKFLAYMLSPLSLVYRVIIFFRRILYKLKTKKFPIPVIVVGNITVGGTGKTPFVIWLAEYLIQQGYKPGIVSRGYGGHAKRYPQLVTQDSTPEIVGDEPLLIANRTQCPVVVDPKRPRAVQYLLNNTDCNIVISDDGLQHYALGRDVEIVIIDGERRLGNGFCLPAGPLREPATRLNQVDFIVTNGQPNKNEYEMRLWPVEFVNIKQPTIKVTETEFFQDKQLHAIAGIGNPSRFFKTLHEMGLNFEEHPFPDHHKFTAAELDITNDAYFIMTEKDAVKCHDLVDERYWYLKVDAVVDEELKTRLAKVITS